MKLVITTGTFGFPALIDRIVEAVDDISEVYSEIHIQYGSILPPSLLSLSKSMSKSSFHAVPYYKDFRKFISQADLVITHAGTGTVLSLLKEKVPFIIVPNKSLLHNHQTEYADSLKHILTVSTVESIVEEVKKTHHQTFTLSASSSIWTDHLFPLLHLKTPYE